MGYIPSQPAEVTYAGYLNKVLILAQKLGICNDDLGISTYPTSRARASRSDLVFSFSLSIANASSGVIASVIYLKTVAFTSSSCHTDNETVIKKVIAVN